MGHLQRKPSPVDVHVGSRIRVRRRVLGLSQEHLAQALGLTFQQVQKYEHGTNRISASKLFGIADTLQVTVGYFFQGLPGPQQTNHNVLVDPEEMADPEAEHAIRAFLNTTEGLELARRFPLIPKGRLRKQVLELVRALTEEADSTAETAARQVRAAPSGPNAAQAQRPGGGEIGGLIPFKDS